MGDWEDEVTKAGSASAAAKRAATRRKQVLLVDDSETGLDVMMPRMNGSAGENVEAGSRSHLGQ